MAQMIPVHKTRFPNAFQFLERELPLLPTQNPGAWAAFTKFSNLPEEVALRAIAIDGSPPVLFASPLGESTWGLFDPDAPGRISVSSSVLTRFEGAPSGGDAQKFLLAKVLHELCHWGCFRRNVTDNDEAGENFERAAFGLELQPWWITAPPAPSVDVFADAVARAAECKEMLFKAGHVPGRLSDPSRLVFGGEDVTEPMARGYRNNNPGNIRTSAIAWRGLAEPGDRAVFQKAEGSFCVFREPEWGIRAMAVLLRTYKREHNLVTPRGIISRYAPAGDNNDVASYSSALAKALGVSPDAVVDADDGSTAITMIQAMARHENGMKAPYSDAQFKAALLLI